MSPPILFNNPLDSLVSKLLKTDGAMDRGWMVVNHLILLKKSGPIFLA